MSYQNNTLTKTCFYSYTGFLFLLIGYGFYLFIRDFDPLNLGIAVPTLDEFALPGLPVVLLSSLPSFLHVVGFTLISLGFISNTQRNIRRTTIFWFFINLCFEAAQGLWVFGDSLLPGTSDPVDILFITLGSIFVYLLISFRDTGRSGAESLASMNNRLSRKVSQVVISIVGVFCLTGSVEPRYEAEPVYLRFEELRQPLVTTDREQIMQGTHYLHYESYLLINEKAKGIHVIETSKEEAPEYIAFLKIPGNHRIFVKEGYLYADNFVDLIVIDISDETNFHIVHRAEDVFPNNPYQIIGSYDSLVSFDETKGVVVDVAYTSVPVSESENYIENNHQYLNDLTIEGNTLFALVEGKVLRFDVDNPLAITVQSSYLRSNSSTLVSFTPIDGYLVTYDGYGRNYVIDTNVPVSESYPGQFQLQGGYEAIGFVENKAFGWNACYSCDDESHLALFNIDDINNPVEERRVPMDKPFRFALENDYLFSCHASEILLVNRLLPDGEYEAIETGHDIYCSEVTVNHDRLFIRNSRGFTQYDYSVTPFILEGAIRSGI